ncbi:hypothetical protein CRENBAI_004954 [Crenichthys baileyi]|uniref:Uncharacterized protein n=1 Tax=Crenichthys baileyi TaxID=28760 RepID=A0AAV9SF20_9TELE
MELHHGAPLLQARRYPGGMRPAEFGSGRTRRSGVRTRRNPRNGDTKRMRGTRPMHPDGSRKGKIGSAFTPPPFGGPRSHGRNGGLVLLGARRPRTTYPSLSLLEGVCARPRRPRSAFAARSRSTDWPDRNEPPHAPVSRSHVSRCPPNGIAIWDTKCMRGTRPMHPDGSRKGKIGSAFTPRRRSGVRGPTDATGGSFFSASSPPHGLVRHGPDRNEPPHAPVSRSPTSHDAPLTESQYGTQSVREGHGQCIWMGIARENVTHIYPSRSGVRGPADATGGSFFSVRGPERHIRGSASWKVFCARPRPRSAFAARSRSTD